jgi:hypothetical protein
MYDLAEDVVVSPFVDEAEMVGLRPADAAAAAARATACDPGSGPTTIDD